jgi:HPt (histidine-containing phosphotransfer) domain-containing protein
METTKITDLTYLSQLANGSDEFMETMISLFISETPSAIEHMEESWERGDWKALKAIAHKMKPSFGFMGIGSMKAVIEALETDVDEKKDPLVIQEKILHLKSVCRSAVAELRRDLKSYSKPSSRL